MGRILLVGRTGDYGEFLIPYEEALSVQCKQAIIHHVFWRRNNPEFICPMFKRDVTTEVYELFAGQAEINGIMSSSQFVTLLNMGINYLINFESAVEYFVTKYHEEPVLIPISNDKIDRVALVV